MTSFFYNYNRRAIKPTATKGFTMKNITKKLIASTFDYVMHGIGGDIMSKKDYTEYVYGRWDEACNLIFENQKEMHKDDQLALERSIEMLYKTGWFKQAKKMDKYFAMGYVLGYAEKKLGSKLTKKYVDMQTVRPVDAFNESMRLINLGGMKCNKMFEIALDVLTAEMVPNTHLRNATEEEKLSFESGRVEGIANA